MNNVANLYQYHNKKLRLKKLMKLYKLLQKFKLMLSKIFSSYQFTLMTYV